MSKPHQQAVALLTEALMVAADHIDDGTALGLTRQWDSLAHMRLILALEERLGRQLGPQQIVGIGSFADVVALLDASDCRGAEPRSS